MENPLANSVGPDQMPHYVGSDLGLHCLSMTLLRVSRKHWINVDYQHDTKPQLTDNDALFIMMILS